MPEHAALERSTAALKRLTGEVGRLSARLDTERRERKKTVRRITVAFVAAIVMLIISGGIVAVAIHQHDLARQREVEARQSEVERRATELREDEQARCEATNLGREGTRNANRILIDKLFEAAAGNTNPHNPTTVEQIERLRVQVQEAVLAELDRTQPIVDCSA